MKRIIKANLGDLSLYVLTTVRLFQHVH